MKRRLVNSLAWAMAALSAAAAVLWVRGSFTSDAVTWNLNGRGLLLSSQSGLLIFGVNRDTHGPPWSIRYQSQAMVFGLPVGADYHYSDWGVAEFAWSRTPGVGTEWGAAVQLWLVAALLALPPASWAAWRWRRRRAERRLVAGLCPRCGYDLRASTERCPECGEPVAGAAPGGAVTAPR